jgi:hypothetical protein
MSDNNNAFGFGSYVPGFDFLQGLVQSASKGAAGGMPQGAPDWSKWVAPTLKAEEIDKRISELKTVQFWLEQNARALAATIQALEVQKMTLATLRSMNVQVNDLAGAFGFGPGAAANKQASAERSDSASNPYADMFTHKSAEPAAEPSSGQAPAPETGAPTADQPGSGAPAGDPLQWWNALAGQFQQIAAGAMQDAAEQARTHPGAGLQEAARQAFDAAGRMAADVAKAAATVVVPKPQAQATKKAVVKKAAVKKTVAAPKPPARRAAAVRKPAAKTSAIRKR